MTLSEELHDLIHACFTGILIETHEPPEALGEIFALCRSNNWSVASWDIESGVSGTGGFRVPDATDPLAALNSIGSIPREADSDTTVFVMKNLHKFFQSIEMIQSFQRHLVEGKVSRNIVVGLVPSAKIPVELEKLFITIEHDMPDRHQIKEIVGDLFDEGESPSGDPLDRIVDAAMGMTRTEAENAFSLSMVRHKEIDPDTVWDLKSGVLKKSGLLELYRGEEDFGSIGGLDNLKNLCRKSLNVDNLYDPMKRPRGVLLLGVSGTGKSAFAKALGKEMGRPTLVLDIGSLMGSLVGETESNIRQALKIADALEPSILFVDELEKALSGSGGSGKSDSGVSSRLLGTLLTWMNDHTSNVYLIATCNDITQMPPELSRAERFDAVVFLDLPGRQQKDLIWGQYRSSFGIDKEFARPRDEQWTGAEIKSCCRLSRLLDVNLEDASQNIVPVAVTASEKVESLRKWASNRCLDSEKSGVYSYSDSKSKINKQVKRNVSSGRPKPS